MAGPRESWLANVVPSDCWSGKVHGRANRKSVGKESTIEQSVGKVYHQTIGREKSIAGLTESRSAMLRMAIKQSVGKDMSVGKRLSRLDFPQQIGSVGNSLSRPTVCRWTLFSLPTCLLGM